MSGQSSDANHEPGRFPWGAIHGVGGITIMGYLDAMLHRWAPDGTLYGGGRLLFKAIKELSDPATPIPTAARLRLSGSAAASASWT